MRFHRLTTRSDSQEVLVDLDKISCLMPPRMGGEGSEIVVHGMVLCVREEFADLMALISPPAAPDTHKEELAKLAAKKLYGVESDEWNALWQITKRRDAEWRQARLNELTWMACRVMTWAKGGAELMLRHIAERRAEIEQGRG